MGVPANDFAAALEKCSSARVKSAVRVVADLDSSESPSCVSPPSRASPWRSASRRAPSPHPGLSTTLSTRTHWNRPEQGGNAQEGQRVETLNGATARHTTEQGGRVVPLSQAEGRGFESHRPLQGIEPAIRRRWAKEIARPSDAAWRERRAEVAPRRVGCGRTLVLSRWGSRTRPPAAHRVPDRLSGSRAIRANTGRSSICTRRNGWTRAYAMW
jgi:hypothetical protein